MDDRDSIFRGGGGWIGSLARLLGSPFARILAGLLAAAGLGTVTVQTAPQILIPPEAIEQVAAPDRWYGKQGRENRERIAALETQGRESRDRIAALELRHEHDQREIAALRAAVRTLEQDQERDKEHRQRSDGQGGGYARIRKCERDVAVMQEQISALQKNCRQMQADYQ